MPKIPKKRNPYGEEDLKRALEDVNNGIKIREAARIYNVPYTTLYDRWNIEFLGKNRRFRRKMSAIRASENVELSPKDEKFLADWVVSCSKKGHTVTKEQLFDSVQMLCKKTVPSNNVDIPRPGKSWYDAFMKRHPKISVRSEEDKSANVSQEDLNQWYGNIGRYLQEKGLLNLPPSRVFICNDSSFPLSPDDDGFTANCGTRESLITMFMFAANGDLGPPMVLYRNDKIPGIIMNKSPIEFSIGYSSTECMTGLLFYEYISNVFYMWLRKKKIEFPVVLYVDGPSSYITMALSNFCKAKQIELIILHPATTLMQTLNASYFDPLQTAWRETLISWCTENNVQSITYVDFSKVLYNVMMTLDQSAVSSGLKNCGIYPFNALTIINTEKVFVKSKTSLSPQDCPEEPEEISSQDYAIALRVLEKQIPNSIIDKFVAREKSTWNGPLEYEGLFHVWRNMKRLCSNNSDSDASESTTMDSDGSEDSFDEVENTDVEIVGI